MSMTSRQAEEQVCPLSGGEGQCDGWCCPKWVVERLPSGAICCDLKETNTGSEFVPDDKNDWHMQIMKCRLEHDIPNCRECPAAYGHCSG